MKARLIISEVIVFFLILVWVYAAISKWLDPQFIYQLTSSSLIGNSFAGILYYGLPLSELIIALLLLREEFRLLGLLLSAILLSTFTVYIIYILSFAPAVPCSCGGVISNLSWGQHLMFNIICLSVNLAVLIIHKNSCKYNEKNEL